MARTSELTRELSSDPAFKQGYERAQAYLQLGQMLRALREEKNLTQAELAKLADLDQAEISRIENGRWGARGISYEVLERLLPVFRLQVSRAIEPVPGSVVTPAAREAMVTMTALLAVE